MRHPGLTALLLVAAIVVWWQVGQRGTGPATGPTAGPAATAAAIVGKAGGDGATGFPAFLPREAVETLELIERGGPFRYSRDGGVFENRERRLPVEPRGYYREYTVPTPGARDRGARRIVVAGDPSQAYFYTDDHYRSFRRVEVRPMESQP